MKKYCIPLLLIFSTASTSFAGNECKVIIEWAKTSHGRILSEVSEVSEGLKAKGYDVYEKNNSRPTFTEKWTVGTVRLMLRGAVNQAGQEVGDPDGALMVETQLADRETYMTDGPFLQRGVDLVLSRVGDRQQFEQRARGIIAGYQELYVDGHYAKYRSRDQLMTTPLMRQWHRPSEPVCIPSYTSDSCNSFEQHKPVNPDAAKQFLASIPECKK